MIEIMLNGVVTSIPTDSHIEAVVRMVTVSPKGIAAALNGEVVSRSLWGSTSCQAGDVIEIVTAAAGG
jgi:sulfur carrier protein